ncbi:MAG: sugar 3,4-ketoisomerase [Alloprevotella sp.]
MKDFIVKLPSFADERGRLIPVSTRGTDLPFEVGRVFWITDVPEGTVRGCHAHRTCREVLFALHGSLEVCMDDGVHPPFTVVLDKPDEGLLIPPMWWCRLSRFAPGTVCLCLASGDYDKEGYLETYDAFRAAVQAGEILIP